MGKKFLPLGGFLGQFPVLFKTLFRVIFHDPNPSFLGETYVVSRFLVHIFEEFFFAFGYIKLKGILRKQRLAFFERKIFLQDFDFLDLFFPVSFVRLKLNQNCPLLLCLFLDRLQGFFVGDRRLGTVPDEELCLGNLVPGDLINLSGLFFGIHQPPNPHPRLFPELSPRP
ncbi:MAG: hypothetical protein ACD_61C00220G0001 [uncultured bacterium]|nr:MAG: hypothetical protein ACD_61C00220G0001 [uncultured bacterium]